MSALANIGVFTTSKSEAKKKKASELARRLDIPFCDDESTSLHFHLVYTDYCLELQENPRLVSHNFKPIRVDFLENERIARRIRTTTISSPLAKAMGIKPNVRPTVIDTTAGLGVDAMSLAWLGCSVHLIERNPIIHALLEDGIRRAKQHKELAEISSKRIVLSHGNSPELLASENLMADSILVDPMYPESKKSQLNRKEMQLLKEIVGQDEDASLLFTAALNAAKKRVVVKRPKGAPQIDHSLSPHHHIPMKSGRFDVYIKAHL